MIFFFSICLLALSLLFFLSPLWRLRTRIKKIHHIDNDSFDLKVTKWVWVDNPKYIGNIFQSRGWYEEKEYIITKYQQHEHHPKVGI